VDQEVLMTGVNSRRSFLRQAALTPATGAVLASLTKAAPYDNSEWRNKQSSMAYRKLGRTGMMISEVVSGGDPITSDNYKQLNLAIEMGLNYLDMAPAYNRGDTELAYGKLLVESPGLRNKVFLTTEVSSFLGLRNRTYKEIFDRLPGDKRSALTKRAEELRRANIAEKPGYYLDYFPGQRGQFPPTYLSLAMMPEYAEQVEGRQEFRTAIKDSIDGSLKRVGTDHFDILMCPHGACMPEELDNPHIHETFLEIKKEGKARFLGLTSHNNQAANLRKAMELGHYDVMMLAYNVVNGGYLEQPILDATDKGMGIIAMKAAHAVATHHKPLQPVPQWRIDKVNRIVPGDMKAPMKAYLWALQNPRISAVISNLWDETFVRENLSLAGKKIDLQPA
jgi:aryl-alcohol dehydrogenase-like predicted oxidoreductase